MESKNTLKICFLGLLLAFSISSCKKEKEKPPQPDPPYTVPTTYNFSNADYSGQTYRIAMLEELIIEAEMGNMGMTVDAQVLKDMYSNTGNPFTDNTLNTSGKQMKDKTFSSDQSVIEGYMDALATASQSTSPGSNGTAGVVTSNDGTSTKLYDANGFVLFEMIEKGLMGALIYYQAVEVYLGDDLMGPNTITDNTIVRADGRTDMEKYWDEAFGYFGVPIDFPANTIGVSYWSNYLLGQSVLLGNSKEKMMNAFLKGRAAISNKDMATKNAQAAIIKTEWERLVAAMAISYLNKGITYSSPLDNARRNGALSEAVGFINALKYNSNKKITNTQISTLLSLIGTNLYNANVTDLTTARDQLSTIYEMDSIKASL
ncbi:MAG: DUF4856 domain-containing protein [Cytophagaceae bacterium]|nr:DUF4856 domain-containing protein [Cytophagaceae bacterium]